MVCDIPSGEVSIKIKKGDFWLLRASGC